MDRSLNESAVIELADGLYHRLIQPSVKIVPDR